MLFESTGLGIATGFFWQLENDLFLITNWHNVSGRDPFTGLHISTKTAAEPNKLRIWWNKKDNIGTKFPVEYRIRDSDNNPLWHVHPKYKNQIDVVALPINPPADAEPYPINQIPQDNLLLKIGMDIFVLGYPFITGPSRYPIWKRGSIASEPEVLDQDRPVILIDSASRKGMSGSPVIRRSHGSHSMAGGPAVLSGRTMTKFVGVYSGRLATNDANDPQLGLTWPAIFVEEIVAGGMLDLP